MSIFKTHKLEKKKKKLILVIKLILEQNTAVLMMWVQIKFSQKIYTVIIL